MRRLIAWFLLPLAVAIMIAGCGDDSSGESATLVGPGSESEATTTTEPVAVGGDSTDGDSTEGEATSDDGSTEAPSDPETTTTAAAEGGETSESAPPSSESQAVNEVLASVRTDAFAGSFRGEAWIPMDAIPGAPQLVSASYEVDAQSDVAVTVSIPPGLSQDDPEGAAIEVRYVAGTAYVNTGDMGDDGTEWFIAELDESPDMMASGMGGLACLFPQSADAAAGSCDIGTEMATLVAGATDADFVGREEVRGVDATRLSFTVTLESIEFAMPDGSDELELTPEEQQMLGQSLLGALGFGAGVTVDAWVDDDGYIRQLGIDLFGALAEVGEATPQIVLYVDFYDFGADISVDAPPAELVAERPA